MDDLDLTIAALRSALKLCDAIDASPQSDNAVMLASGETRRDVMRAFVRLEPARESA